MQTVSQRCKTLPSAPIVCSLHSLLQLHAQCLPCCGCRAGSPADGHGLAHSHSMPGAVLTPGPSLLPCPADLQGMGGLPPLVAQLAAGRPAALQAAAAHALGTAAQNNHQFQAQLLGDHPEVLHLLLALVGHSSEPFGAAGAAAGGPVAAADEPAASAGLDAGLKALYALSAILRLNAGARAAFYAAGGVHTLQQLLGSAAAGPGARKKAAALLADLVHLDAPAMHAAAAATTAAQQQHAQPGASAPAAALDFSAAVAAALQLLDVDSLPLQGGDLDLQVRCVHLSAHCANLPLQQCCRSSTC